MNKSVKVNIMWWCGNRHATVYIKRKQENVFILTYSIIINIDVGDMGNIGPLVISCITLLFNTYFWAAINK